MLNVEVSGHGKPIVLIHGFCENLNLWQALTADLEKKYQVIAVDLPGFGRSESMEGPPDLDTVAEVLHNYIRQVLNLEKYVVLGHSLGGYISLAMTDLFPESILGFGLINSTSFADSEDKKSLRNKTVKFIKSQGVQAFLQNFVKNLFTPANQSLLLKEMDLVCQMGKNLSINTLISYMIAMRDRPDRSHLLQNCEKVILIEGLLDNHISYLDIEKQVNLVDHKQNCYLYENVAHMSMYEEPELLTLAINDFLSTILIG